MSRTIKFRIWDKERAEYDDYFELTPRWTTVDGILDNDAYIVEQYTGLKDKYGREIYEGDIVQSRSHSDGFIATVWWDEYLAAFMIGAKPLLQSATINEDYTLPNWEVIGNVNKDKKLLEALE
jgi:uncharacterized phage protein (TIGR01671 family)